MGEIPTTAPLRADRAEREIIGACLIDPSIVSTLALTPEEFFSQGAAETFRAMKAIVKRGDVPIFTTLCRELMARGNKVKPSVLVEIAADCATSVYATAYAAEVRRAATRRRLLSASGNVADAANDPRITDTAAVDLASSLILDVAIATPDESTVSDGRGLVELLNSRREAVLSGKSAGLGTGYTDLDRHITGGLRGGQFCVVGARTGVGKSAMMRDMARAMCLQGRVLYISSEMSKADLIARDVSVLSEVPLAAIASAKWNDLDQDRITQANTTIEFMPLLTVSEGALTSEKVRALVKQVHHEEPIIAVFVDYIQRMADPGRTDLERVSRIARHLKSIAMDLDLPLIAGSQLSRRTEQENLDARPTLTDLRSSGEIEQEADIVLLLYRASKAFPNEESWNRTHKNAKYPGNIAELMIAKQRQGVSGVIVNLLWVPQLATFHNFARTP